MSAIVFDPVDEVIDLILSEKSFDAVSARLSSLKKKEFRQLLDRLSEAYYHKNPIATDDVYDSIEEVYESKFGKNKKIGSVPPASDQETVIRPSGSQVERVPLPYYMGGLDKAKDDKSLDLWFRRQPSDCEYVQSDKLDGVSVALITTIDEKTGAVRERLLKRGDEKEGTDISYMLPFLKRPKVSRSIAVRGELVIPVKVFVSKYQSKGAMNPRNTVAGLTNSKTASAEQIRDIHFVAYSVLSGKPLKKSDQFRLIEELGYETPSWTMISSCDFSADNFTSDVKRRKRMGSYDIDGIVIDADVAPVPITSGNPDNSVAFKIAGETAVTTVLGVKWAVSKHGVYKPRVNVESVRLSGVKIDWATGFNGKFIVDNGVGRGAKVLITRSNDVIPYILEIIEKSSPELPEGEYEWNENGVEITLPRGQESEEKDVSRMVAFFKEVGVKFLGESTVKKLYEGGMRTLSDLFCASEEDIIGIEGFQAKGAERIVESIRSSIDGAHLSTIMAASSVFPNFGAKRLRQITDEYPDVMNASSEEELENLRKGILNLKGFKKLADVFVAKLPEFKEWIAKHPQVKFTLGEQTGKEEKDELSDSRDPLTGQVIVCTGWRMSTPLQREVEKRKASVGSSVTGKTTILVAKNLEARETEKVKSAREKGVTVIDKASFLELYGLKE